MKFRWLLLFAVIFAFESFKVVLGDNNSAPQIGDAAEVHNIAYNLAHGRGYSFDWNDERWRELWQEQNADGRLDFVVVRRGSYPTMFRPPLMPIMVAAILKVLPHSSFLAWRLFDSAAFSAAACLLCDAAFALDGFAGLSAVLVLLMVDPLRRQYIPGLVDRRHRVRPPEFDCLVDRQSAERIDPTVQSPCRIDGGSALSRPVYLCADHPSCLPGAGDCPIQSADGCRQECACHLGSVAVDSNALVGS